MSENHPIMSALLADNNNELDAASTIAEDGSNYDDSSSEVSYGGSTIVQGRAEPDESAGDNRRVVIAEQDEKASPRASSSAPAACGGPSAACGGPNAACGDCEEPPAKRARASSSTEEEPIDLTARDCIVRHSRPCAVLVNRLTGLQNRLPLEWVCFNFLHPFLLLFYRIYIYICSHVSCTHIYIYKCVHQCFLYIFSKYCLCIGAFSFIILINFLLGLFSTYILQLLSL